jgi:hypothetical protein
MCIYTPSTYLISCGRICCMHLTITPPPSHLIHPESAGPDVHDLETKLNGYVRLYTDSQSEVEKLKLDLRRFEQNSEAEKVRPRDI